MKYLKRYNEDIEWEFEDDEGIDIHSDFERHENFYNFLVDNNALDKYIYNFKKDTSLWRGSDLKSFLDHTNKDNYIIFAFKWKETPEDYEYWSMIHFIWYKLNKSRKYLISRGYKL